MNSITQSKDLDLSQKKHEMICALCHNDVTQGSILSDDYAFCCPGCMAVFNILVTKGEINDYQTNPLFHQALKSGLISNPLLIEQIRNKRMHVGDGELEKLHLEVNDMWCPSCAEVIRLFLLQEKGVNNCVVDYATDLASVEYVPRYISKERIYGIIRALGYRPASLQGAESRVISSSLYLRFIIAAFCSLNVMMFAYPLYATYFDYDDQNYGRLFAWLSLGGSLPVLGYSGWPIFRRFVSGIMVGLWGMEALVVMGVATAFGYSLYELIQGGTKVYFDSMTVIIVFVLLGKIIETKAKFSAKESLLRLSRSIPRRGRKILAEGTTVFVPVKDLGPGESIMALMGEKIVLDGIVTEGSGTCDESFLTGESLPVLKTAGSRVLGGALLTNGNIKFRIDSTPEESVLQRIIQMVEQDIGHKSAYVRAADKIVRWFVPTVLLVAFGTAITILLFGITDEGKGTVETAIIRAAAIFLISCPCAIGIAAPLAESHLINALASLGAIIRNRGCLQFLGRETVFVFDKTGTITEGRYEVLDGISILTGEQRSILKGLAIKSNHPIACAVALSIEEKPSHFEKVEEIAGKGLRGLFQGELYFLGSKKFLEQQGVNIPVEEMLLDDAEVRSIVYFGKAGSAYKMKLGDRIREGSKGIVENVKPAKAILLSGDSHYSVKTIAKLCGFDFFHAEASPLDKREYIEEMKSKGEIICMIGDGINDAPALTSAHVGISVVTASDISIQVSDILLTTDRLQVIEKMRVLAISGRKIVKQNLFWAFFYNVVGIGLAAFGLLSPIFAACAMVISSLMVLFNAQRLSGKDER